MTLSITPRKPSTDNATDSHQDSRNEEPYLSYWKLTLTSGYPWFTRKVTAIPLTYDDHSIVAEIALAELGGGQRFNFEIIASGYPNNQYWYADDCASNAAGIHSPTGSIVPPQDDDADGRLDWQALCLEEPEDWEPGYIDPYQLQNVVEIF
jgi:hypothetical protein